MKKITLGKSDLQLPNIAVGCMRLNSLDKKGAADFINNALDNGANFFDHADIYGGGECEKLFSEAIDMKPSVRDKMIIQTKCGIVPGKMFNFSKEHILESVDGSLKRLKTDYIDILLLHRPDTLMEPEEIAEAFDILKTTGKVRNFGVSNQNPYQIQLLSKYINQPILVNQLQLSAAYTPMFDAGFNVNTMFDAGVNRDGGVLEFCRLNDITIQAWSPFQHGFFKGCFIDSEKYPELNKKLEEIGEKYGITKTGMALAWILRHPAKIQPVTGTTNMGRLNECIAASEVYITREEWYEIYLSAGNILP
ncbi:MAG: aldo/keto reductase [Clostridia bacterium]|nr:aldo/keto reductase [Clostridia bacterium]